MLALPFPGNVFGIARVPAVDKDPADYFVVCGGGGAAKTGVANAVSVIGVALNSAASGAIEDAASPGETISVRANAIQTISTEDRMVSSIAVDGARKVAAAAAGASVELMPLTILDPKAAIATSAEGRFTAGSVLPPDAGLETSNAEVECVDVSADGRLIATGQEDGRVRIWEAAAPAASAAGGGASSSSRRRLLGELRSEWRPIEAVQAMERQGRAIKRENPRKVDGLSFVGINSSSSYILVSRSKDGGSTVWPLTLQQNSKLECAGAIALPCLGPNVVGHRHAPVGGKRSARPGERDAGKWWHRSVIGSYSASTGVLDLIALESSERGGSLLALWRLQHGSNNSTGADGSHAFSFYPDVSAPSSSSSSPATAGFTPDQLDPTPRQLAVQVSQKEASASSGASGSVEIIARFSGSAAAAGAGSGVAFKPLACAWREADSQPAGAMALAVASTIKPAGKDVPAPPAIPFSLPCLLVGTQDGRVAVHDIGSLKRVGRSQRPLGSGEGEPLIALSYAAQSRCVVAGVGRQVVVLPLQAIPQASGSGSSSIVGRAIRWCCGGHSLFSPLGLANLVALVVLIAVAAVLTVATLARSSPALAAAILKAVGFGDGSQGQLRVIEAAPILAALLFPGLFAGQAAGHQQEAPPAGSAAPHDGALYAKAEL